MAAWKWFQDFLLQLGDEKISRGSLEREVAISRFACKRLGNLFRNDFNDRMLRLFGLMLTRIGEEDFLRLLNVKNFYLHNVSKIGELHWLKFPDPDRPGAFAIFDLKGLSDLMILAAFAHETFHALNHEGRTKSDGLNLDLENETNEQLEKWGFGFGRDLLREHLKKMKGEN